MDRPGVTRQAVAVPFIVDGMNVIGTEPDGWWRDRGAARRRLVENLGRLDDGADITVVFDGHAQAGEEAQAAMTAVRVCFAPGGPNAADDAIVAMVRALAVPADITVVTSDRALVERVRGLGAKVESAKSFRSRLADPGRR
jgi:predicted RNA-binding protein with PIN domain